MKSIEEKILKEGIVIGDDILKVDSFVNHRIDTSFVLDVCKYFASEFNNIDKVVTIETSGLAYAVVTAIELGNVPVVFAKKSKSKIVDENNVYKALIKSFTRGTTTEVTIDKRFLNKNERILIVDDFLAEGNAAKGLIDLCEQAGAKVVGFATVIDKAFQGGREYLESRNIKLVSGASIKRFENGKVIF